MLNGSILRQRLRTKPAVYQNPIGARFFAQKRFCDFGKNIDGDLSELSGHALLNDACGLPSIEALTWLQVLQIMVDEWNDATVINATDPRTIASTTALGVVGVLDDMARVATLLEGVPL